MCWDLKLIIFDLLYPFAFVLVVAHFDSCSNKFLLVFPCRNSLVRKSRRELFFPLINSMSKSKAERIACHLANIYFETRFLTSFCKISFANLQYIRSKNFCKINRLEILKHKVLQIIFLF